MNDKKEIEVTSIDFAKFICNNKNYNVYKLINKDELKSYVETVWLNHKVPIKEFFTFIDWDRLIIDCGNIVSFDTKVINLSTAKSYLDSIASIVDNKVIATINGIDIKTMTTEELIQLRDAINNILEV